MSTYLAFLHLAQTRRRAVQEPHELRPLFEPSVDSEDCTGRALWALGTAVHLAGDEGQRMLARQMFERGLPRTAELGPRGAPP